MQHVQGSDLTLVTYVEFCAGFTGIVLCYQIPEMEYYCYRSCKFYYGYYHAKLWDPSIIFSLTDTSVLAQCGTVASVPCSQPS